MFDFDWEDILNDIHDEVGDIGFELKKRLTCEVESLGKEYQMSASNTIIIGKYLDTLAKTLIRNSPNQIQENIKTYCIGHSLGAQVCGFFGKNFQKKRILQNSDDDEPTFIPARDKNLFLLECCQNRSLIGIWDTLLIHYCQTIFK